jgi:hypothetical protein
MITVYGNFELQGWLCHGSCPGGWVNDTTDHLTQLEMSINSVMVLSLVHVSR